MKKVLILVFYTILCSYVNAQANLVPNPSFEDTVSCPNLASQIERAVGWTSYRISPDYYNICDTNPFFGVPTNFYGGYQQPRTGVAYAGLEVFAINVFFHEIMGIQLSQPLVVGQTYYCGYFVSRGVGGFDTSLNVACNKLGMRFLTQPYYFLTNPIPIDDSVDVVTNTIIADTSNWTLVSGCFTADSAYQYLAIGIFNSDININYINYSTSQDVGAYYYVDDVFVEVDTVHCPVTSNISPEVENTTLFKVFPNPFDKELYILSKTDSATIELSDASGRIIKNEHIVNGYNKILISDLCAGLYIITFNNDGKLIQKKLVKIHN